MRASRRRWRDRDRTGIEMRKTLKTGATLKGVGLHGGQHVTLSLEPAPVRAGIQFVRVDVPIEQQMIPARYDLVTDTRLCTKLTNEHGVSVGTVEHVMAALAGCGITDALIVLDGPEVPIMDGSSSPFVEAIAEAGVEIFAEAPAAIRIVKPVRIEDGDKWAELLPADRFEMEFKIDFADPAIGQQAHAMRLTNGAFFTELSNCRTFGHMHEVEALRSMGLARGGSLQNAIVVDQGRVLNPEGLRRPDEFVRHKMLDAVGDLALAGAPIIGLYRGEKAGHEMTNKLLHALFAQPDAWVWDVLGQGQGFDHPSGRGAVSEDTAAIAV